eukprot:387689_1
MDAFMHSLRQQLVSIVDQLRATVAKEFPAFEDKLLIRFGGIGFRDVSDPDQLPFVLHFSSGTQAEINQGVKAWLQTLQCDGGGDIPEDVFGAIKKAMNHLKWA